MSTSVSMATHGNDEEGSRARARFRFYGDFSYLSGTETTYEAPPAPPSSSTPLPQCACAPPQTKNQVINARAHAHTEDEEGSLGSCRTLKVSIMGGVGGCPPPSIHLNAERSNRICARSCCSHPDKGGSVRVRVRGRAYLSVIDQFPGAE